ncbi:Trypsin-1 [Orchesella cincta]|uniref:Trypsin-1 n=1 Tax=Orchesella cincta TaxID=48709 RepID=A0A1D2MZ33_ORCCI|nr:Trypsin-1 [Orchesella cincta]
MKSAILVLLALGAVSALPRFKSVPDRIVGGSQASKGEFPHIIQIKRNGGQYCGGSLVNANYIVTAAHCATASVAGYTLVAGEHNLNSNEGTEQSRSVSSIVRHPQYNANTQANDVAVMRVSSPFTLNTNVRAVTLPSSSFNPASQLTVAGWGTLTSGGNLPTILMKVTVPLVSTATCRNAYGSQIVAGMLCAGTAGKDSCQGDSGGPLMSGSTLAGIVSWGYGCAAAGYPGVYADVAYYSSWINGQTR